MSRTERALKAKAETGALIQAAIREQLTIIKDAEKTLEQLGYAFPVKGTGSENGNRRKSAPEMKQTRSLALNTVCKICEFTTNPPHDSRKHRGQKLQKAFTLKELEEFGLKKK